MGNAQLRTEHMKWVTLMTIAIVVFVDATVPTNFPELEELVAYNSDISQQIYKHYMKRVNYEGDQVWRIYKHNDSVNDLVEQYHEFGCT